MLNYRAIEEFENVELHYKWRKPEEPSWKSKKGAML